MAKNLLERVTEHSKSGGSSVKSTAKIFILANREEIQKTLEKGFEIKTIWETLKKENRIDCTYSRFCRMLKKYLYAENDKKAVTVKQKMPDSKIRGFKFNSTPNEKDLY